MELGLKNKVAFVAASSQGLGKSVALELAKEGAKVIINGRFNESLERVKQEIEQQTNAEVLALSGDLSVAVDGSKLLKTHCKLTAL
jgi:3-oxoacyl-[acyl-carrier protein] reductase